MIQQFHVYVYTWKNYEHGLRVIGWQWYYSQLKLGGNLQNAVYIHTIKYYLGFKKEWNSDTCYNIRESWGCYAKKKKSQSPKDKKAERGRAVTRDWKGERMWRYCSMATEFQIYMMKRVMELDGVDGCMTLWMYLSPLKWTLTNG